MNSVCLVGRLASDPTLYAYGDNGDTVVYLTIAVQRGTKNAEGKFDADFIECRAFNKVGETIKKYVSKGSMVSVEGRINTQSKYNDRTGHNEYKQSVIINKITFLSSKPKEEEKSDRTTSIKMSDINITSEDLPFGD